ncbi:uncharacterized protein LOC112592200 [Melanaphis sacchari]|uniref:uncharacterized protein LOC112592200 n=1 Tax=Melanaphis sacchari TaxID=742174 RepID=UPI000DC14DE4|nr:uncharacterized protein LOC112592200 [Melanaphis sacchari]
MKRFGDIRTFFTNTSKSISTNNQNDSIENPENNPARQGLAFRGHNEKQESSNKGNFLELCELFCKFDSNFRIKYHTYLSYTSHDIQNEILNIISNSTIKVITNEIRRCGKYSLICDEARSFKEEQLSLCVRYCNGFEVCERFIKFIDCSQSRDAESLKNIIINELKQLEIADIPIVAQTYDGASVMSGAVGGLQAKIREKYPTAVYFHCAAHKLALVVTDTYITLGQATSAINGVIQTLQEKRSDKNFKLLWDDITNFSRKFGVCLNYEEFSKKRKPVENQYLKSSLIRKDILKAEMMIVNNYLNSKIKNWTIQDLFSTVTLELYPNLHNLLQVALSIPVSSASCERSFSAMRRIKNWLRTTMIQNRFSNLAIIHIENELVKTSIESKQILEDFAKCGSRRIQLTI